MYKNKVTGKFLTCKDIVETKSYKFYTSLMFEENNIELIDNSPDDILDVTIEAIELAKGINIYSDEDNKLQKLFWSYCPEEIKHGKVTSRIGKTFLRKYQHILL